MKKYNYIGWCMAGSLGLSAMPGQAAQPEKKQPHIILIMTDQLIRNKVPFTTIILQNPYRYIGFATSSVPPAYQPILHYK